MAVNDAERCWRGRSAREISFEITVVMRMEWWRRCLCCCCVVPSFSMRVQACAYALAHFSQNTIRVHRRHRRGEHTTEAPPLLFTPHDNIGPTPKAPAHSRPSAKQHQHAHTHILHVHIGHHFAEIVQRAVRVKVVRMPSLRYDVLRSSQRQRNRQQFRHHRVVRD